MWTIEILMTEVGYKIKMSQSLPNEVRIYFIRVKDRAGIDWNSLKLFKGAPTPITCV